MLPSRRALHAGLLALTIWSSSLFASRAMALELVMFDASWCSYCRLFKSEVLPDYDEHELGQLAPIQIVDVSEQGQFELNEAVDATPTFVLIDDGREVSRFAGYSNPDSFYAALAEHIREHQNP